MTIELPNIVHTLAKYGQDIQWIADQAMSVHNSAPVDTPAEEPSVPVTDPPVPLDDTLTPEDEFMAVLARAIGVAPSELNR